MCDTIVNDVHLFPGLWTIDGYTKVAARLRQRLRLSQAPTTTSSV